jgi:ABC-type dipeptide/oligopeptide/nickel transport system permease component
LTLVFGALFIVVNMIVDLLVVATQPRLRHG